MYWAVVVLLSFGTPDGSLAVGTFHGQEKFPSAAACSEHVATSLEEVQALVKANRYEHIKTVMDWNAVCMKFLDGQPA
jgi:hypothetical protein